MRTLSLLLAGSLLVGGCAVSVAGDPIAAGKPSKSANSLPFTPTIKNRTNDRNDGTTFEPCAAYTNAELLALNIDPATIDDAAKVDGANYRGCHWRATDYTISRGGGDYSQIVGREMSLNEYKTYMKTLRWQTDRQAYGRTIAYAPENNYCIAAFASEQSIVTTSAGSTHPSPGNKAECDRAIAFASLAVTKAP